MGEGWSLPRTRCGGEGQSTTPFLDLPDPDPAPTPFSSSPTPIGDPGDERCTPFHRLPPTDRRPTLVFVVPGTPGTHGGAWSGAVTPNAHYPLRLAKPLVGAGFKPVLGLASTTHASPRTPIRYPSPFRLPRLRSGTQGTSGAPPSIDYRQPTGDPPSFSSCRGNPAPTPQLIIPNPNRDPPTYNLTRLFNRTLRSDGPYQPCGA